MDLANKFLQNWNFLSSVDEANEKITEVKNILKKEYDTKFRGLDDDKGEIVNNQVTDDLDEYVIKVKDKANLFLKS